MTQGVLLACTVLQPSCTLDAGETLADPWGQVPEILSRIIPPQFPDRTFAVDQFGAVGDGSTDCTAAFAEAIAECAAAGGGKVVVPAGKFSCGPIHLKSKVNLYLSEGAEIVFSDKFADYLPPVLVRVGGIELYNYSPLIYARDETDIAVTGPGKLNGNAEAWWAWKSSETRRGFEMGAAGVPVAERVFGTEEAAIRPSFVSFVNCRNVLLEDFTIGSGPNWTIHPVYCENVTIRGVNVLTDGPNNDGIDPDSCRDMLIENCVFDTGDDCVVLKSGYNEDGWRVARPTENVVVRNCSSKRGHGGLVIGSEMSGDVRNVFMEDCQFAGTDRAVRIKSRADRGGVVENVFVRNIVAKDMQREVVILNMDYGSDRSALKSIRPPVFREMVFENITGEGAPCAVRIQGMDSSPIQTLTFRNCSIRSTEGVKANYVRGITFEHCTIEPRRGPVFSLSHANDATIRGASTAANDSVLLRLEGADSGTIVVEDSRLGKSQPRIELGPGVEESAVTIQNSVPVLK